MLGNDAAETVAAVCASEPCATTKATKLSATIIFDAAILAADDYLRHGQEKTEYGN